MEDFEYIKTDVQHLIAGKQRTKARSITADWILQNEDILTMRDNEELYQYKGGYFQRGGRDKVGELVKKIWADITTKQDINEIIGAHIKPLTYIERQELKNDQDITCIQNGLLNVKTGELEAHTPEYQFLFKLPISYNPEAKCPNILQFLDEVVESEDDVETLLQVIGYTLWRGYPTAKVFVLLGEGRNGKSVLINLIKAFLGQENIRSLTMHQLEHDPFGIGLLENRHANINPEINNKTIHTSGAIKSLTGNDTIDANVKNREYKMFVNYAKLIFAANDLPSSDDPSYAWASRWIFIKFPHKFVEDETCPYCHHKHKVKKRLLEELTTEEELSGLLNEALAALKRLIENNWEFSLSFRAKMVEKNYQRLSDNVLGFIEDHIEEDANERTPQSEIFTKYISYCEEYGVNPVSPKTFSQRFKMHLPYAAQTKSGSVRFWQGVILLEKDKQIDLMGRDLET